MVWQVRASYDKKRYRKMMMETWGATFHPSPSNLTESGQRIHKMDPSSPGSLGIAISEGVVVATKNEDTKYCLGSVLNHVLLHQTVIGEKCIKQMEALGECFSFLSLSFRCLFTVTLRKSVHLFASLQADDGHWLFACISQEILINFSQKTQKKKERNPSILI